MESDEYLLGRELGETVNVDGYTGVRAAVHPLSKVLCSFASPSRNSQMLRDEFLDPLAMFQKIDVEVESLLGV